MTRTNSGIRSSLNSPSIYFEMQILQNGGMSACGYALENSFVTENGTGFQDGENIDMIKTRGKLCRSLQFPKQPPSF